MFMQGKTHWSVVDVLALVLEKRYTFSEIGALVETYGGLHEIPQQSFAFSGKHCDAANLIVEHCKSAGYHVVHCGQESYPHRLRRLPAPPPIVFIAGALPHHCVPSIGVVGTRSCTMNYGKPITEQCVKQWVYNGAAIISGLAQGIDSIAHQATLDAGGCTVAVIASGLDTISPAVATKLSLAIVQRGGAVISEYPPHVKAMPAFFPARNRIIAALSSAVVIIESAAKGGALITAGFAKQLNVPLFALPGNVSSARSAGCNTLLQKSQAMMMCQPDDVLRALNIAHSTEPTQSALRQLSIDSSHKELYQAVCQQPQTVEHLADALQCDVSTVRMHVLELEMLGTVTLQPGGFVAPTTRCV
jgi:DNA processing protein